MASPEDDFHYIEERLTICDELNPNTPSKPGDDCRVQRVLRDMGELPSITDNLHSFKEYHRDLVLSALKIRKTCPVCEEDNCEQRCSRCFSVFYCSRECQLKHFPRHKVICKTFAHVVRE